MNMNYINIMNMKINIKNTNINIMKMDIMNVERERTQTLTSTRTRARGTGMEEMLEYAPSRRVCTEVMSDLPAFCQSGTRKEKNNDAGISEVPKKAPQPGIFCFCTRLR
jgi:hypothetical protein